jgi:hypothetical protein
MVHEADVQCKTGNFELAEPDNARSPMKPPLHKRLARMVSPRTIPRRTRGSIACGHRRLIIWFDKGEATEVDAEEGRRTARRGNA